MAGAIYKAEFLVVETPSAENPHKELSRVTKGTSPTNIAGGGQTLGSVAKKMLPKVTTAVAISTAIKTGQFIYDTVNTHQANSALLAGDSIAYKHLQNERIVTSNIIGIGSSIAMAATTGAIAGSVIPGLGTVVGALAGAGVALVTQGIQQLAKIPEYEENKRVFNESAGIERVINSLDRERFGTNAKTYR